MANNRWNPWLGIGFTSLGIGYLMEAWKHKNGHEGEVPSSGGSTNGLGYAPAKGVSNGIRTMKMYPAGDIAQRENYILNQIRKDSEDPKVISEARAVLSGRCPAVNGGSVGWCVRPKDWDGEVRALYRAVTDPNSALAVRYTRDHVTVDLFGSSGLMRRLPAEDCDGMAIRLGALLRSVGYSVRTRVVAPAGHPGAWSHIYLMVSTPPGSNNNWRPLDPTEPEKALASGSYPYWEVGSNVVDRRKRDRDV